jgi:hypothetical protein
MSSKRITIDEAAVSLGKSKRTLERWKAKGTAGFYLLAGIIYVDLEELKSSQGQSSKTPVKKFGDTTSPTTDIADKNHVGQEDSSENIGLLEAKRRKEVAVARIKETELAKLQSKLVEKELVLKLFRSAGHAVRSRAMALPARLSGKLCRIKDTRKMAKELQLEMRNLCKAFENEFGEFNRA